MLWLKLEIYGKQCHASKPDLGVNTLRAAAHFIVALEALTQEFKAVDPFFDPPGSTFEPTKIEANVQNINTIPGLGVFYLDCRVLPEYALGMVIARVKEIAGEVERRFGVTITVKTVQEVQSPPATPADAPVVQALTQAVQAVYKRRAEPRGIGGGTVAAFFRRLGLPAAVWMTDEFTAHQPNEYVNLNHLIGDCQVFAHIFLNAV
jgi:succinyl-diaminopimelate desuccinylase